MKQNIPFGLGWQPDLPDLRDKTFEGALKKMSLASERGNPVQGRKLAKSDATKQQGASKTQEGATCPSHELHTFDGWMASSVASARMATADERLQERLILAIRQAFTTESTRAISRGGLLDAGPPEKAASVDLRPFLSPIEDQEKIGSCTAHAVAGLVEYLQIATTGRYVDASRLFLYKATRDLLQWEGDTGAYIRETIKAMRLFGVCPESHWGYDTAQFDMEPTSFCYAFAANYKALRFYRLQSLDEIKQSLSQGYPVAFGFTCFESLFTNSARITGKIPFPLKTEKSMGGHAVLAVGYSDVEPDKKNPFACPAGHVIIRNSWGESWGKNGYGFLDYKFFTGGGDNGIRLADDFWTMTQMEVPDLDQARTAPFALGEGGGSEVFGDDGGSEVFGSRIRR